METAITQTEKIHFLETKEQYLAMRAAWRKYIADGGKPTAAHFILYNTLRGKDWWHGFVPATNTNKLTNGHAPWLGTMQAKADLSMNLTWTKFREEFIKPFGEGITTEETNRAWQLIKATFPPQYEK